MAVSSGNFSALFNIIGQAGWDSFCLQYCFWTKRYKTCSFDCLYVRKGGPSYHNDNDFDFDFDYDYYLSHTLSFIWAKT